MADENPTPPLCACGCGLPVRRHRRKWRTFRQGHHARTVQTGPAHPNWKTGSYINKRGYVLIRVGKHHPMAGSRGYALEHRLVMSGMLDRLLLPTEVVHHIDGNRANNSPRNLGLCANQSEHIHEQHLEALRRPRAKKPKAACHCGAFVKARGLCENHYAEFRRRKAGQAVLVVRAQCWCGAPHCARGLCNRHYKETRRRERATHSANP